MNWHGNKSHLMVNFPCDLKKSSSVDLGKKYDFHMVSNVQKRGPI
jgi:hypothetical protein